jgi:hypothetical protein
MKIFVSSSVKFLVDLRDVLYRHLKDADHTPFFSEKPGDFPTKLHEDAMTNCLLVVEQCDMLVLILDRKMGLTYTTRPDSPFTDLFGMAITKAEYRCAKKRKIPVSIFVRKIVETESKFYREMNVLQRKNFPIWYADKEIYDFYDELMHEYPAVPWITPFDGVTEILPLLDNHIQEIETLKPNLNVLYKKDLKVPSCWDIISIDGDIATVSDGMKGGLTPFRNHHVSYMCSRCGSYGPWDGNRCLNCGTFEFPY